MARGNNGGGKPEHKPTAQSKKLVLNAARVGMRQDDIATGLGISKNTLRKHYQAILDTGGFEANATVGGKLYSMCMNDDKAAIIFWCKTRLGLRETVHVDNTSSDGTMSPKALPAPKVEFNLSKLNDKQLDQLEKLLSTCESDTADAG